MPSNWMPMATRHQAYSYLLQGKSIRATAKDLNISRSGVTYNRKRVDETMKLINRKSTGMNLLHTPIVKIIDEMIKENNIITKGEIKNQLMQMGHYLSKRQVRYRIQLLGYVWRKAKKVQVISQKNQAIRRDYHVWYCATNYQFDHHIFTDEMTIKLGRKIPFVWAKLGEEVPHVGQLVHGPGVHVWGGISWNGPTGLIIWGNKSRMNSKFYCKNMLPEVVKSGHRLFGGNYQLVQDSHPAHVSGATLEVINEHDITLFPHPPQSPDLMAVEFVWRDIKKLRDKKNPRTRSELIQLIIDFWKTQVTPSYCRTLIRNACRNIERSHDGLNHEKDAPTNKIYHH